MKQIITSLFALSAMMMLNACDSDSVESLEQGKSSKIVPMESFTLTSEQSSINLQAKDFSFRFFQQVNLSQPDDNVFVSPLSAEMLLAMVCNGTSGDTQQEMLKTLGFDSLNVEDLNSYNRLLLDKLPSIDPSTKLVLANGMWARKDFPFVDSFFTQTSQSYDAEIDYFDSKQVKESCDKINGWCKKKTEGMIPKVIDNIDEELVLLLANALYFKGIWCDPFDADFTRDDDFVCLDGHTSVVKMMHDDMESNYYENADFCAVSKYYGNCAYRMWFLLPREEKQLGDCLGRLDLASWQSLVDSGYRGRYEVDFSLPRFELNYERKLNEDLKAMGMPRAFDKKTADFSNMCREYRLYLDYVKQFARIKVDEKGTEAAAVTVGATYGTTSVETPKRLSFHLDRPFAFFITEANTNAVLFAGKVVKF